MQSRNTALWYGGPESQKRKKKNSKQFYKTQISHDINKCHKKNIFLIHKTFPQNKI